MTLVDTPDATAAPVVAPAGRTRGGGGLGRYLVIRFLLIIPTVFILVTLVFLLMRTTGDPITAAQGGRLPRSSWPSASTRRATTGRCSCSTATTSPGCCTATSAPR